MNRYTWIENNAVDRNVIEMLVESLGVPQIGARLLASRGFVDPEAARQFLNPVSDHSHDPFMFDNMREAVGLVDQAVKNKSAVLVHGDYDVDGISGTAILYHYLNTLVPDLRRFVPDRRKDGYGIAKRAVEWAITEKVGLFIAVDCGTSDAVLIERMQDNGIGVIVCDHHEFPPDGAFAGVMLNPSRHGESYPFRSLCGAGVAYKFVEALHRSGIRGGMKPEALLDLAAMATVGDMAPLVGENRYFVRAGLDQMNKDPRPGVGAIKRFTRLGRRPITSTHISFVFAPRINAPGRVSIPKPSLEILCEDSKDTVMQLASRLEGDNERRKELTTHVHKAATTRIRAMENRDRQGGFVLAGADWDEGVLGIAAARVVEEFGRPAILLSQQGDVAKGSGRSVPGVNLKAQLDALQDCFVRYGGHAQAVGLTMQANRIDEFRSGLSDRLAESMSARTERPLHLDGVIAVDECDSELLSFLDRCEPFGLGNKEPIYQVSDVQVLGDTCLVGSGHMKIFFQDTRGNVANAIAFGWDRPETPDDLHGRVIDLAVSVKRGEYRGRVFPELRVVDVRFHRS